MPAQAGLRPALVMQINDLNDILSTVIVVPLTSNLKNQGLLTTAFLPAKKDSIALLHQITTITKKYMQDKCGELSEFDYSVLRTRLLRLIY